ALRGDRPACTRLRSAPALLRAGHRPGWAGVSGVRRQGRGPRVDGGARRAPGLRGLMSAAQLLPAEDIHGQELRFLAAWDRGHRPPGWRLTPRAAVAFITGTGDETLHLSDVADDLPSSMRIAPKFVGQRGLVERAMVTLAGQRGLLLVG